MGSYVIGGLVYTVKLLVKGVGFFLKGSAWYIKNLIDILSKKDKNIKKVSIEGEIL